MVLGSVDDSTLLFFWTYPSGNFVKSLFDAPLD